MSDPYEEIINGERLLRFPPRPRHEEILMRLRRRVAASLATLSTTKLIDLRGAVQVSPTTLLRPDIALTTAATNKLWLAAEVISSDEHHADTVEKKGLYEELKLPRLWMIDPRYDNVEVYFGGAYGLALQHILANKEILTEKLLPELSLVVSRLFTGA